MRTTKHLSLILLGCLVLTGCASLGIKSTPWPNYTAIHDEKAVDFMRNVPAVKSGLIKGGVNNADYSIDDDYVLGISVTGGGMRAAAFSLGVLQGLQEQNVLEDVDFISSNSGGGWGIAAYLSDRAEFAGKGEYAIKKRRVELSEKFEKMSETKIKCLPTSIIEHITGNKTFAELYNNKMGIPLPDHFINAAILPSESGFVFTDEYLKYFQVTEMDACNEKRYPSFDVDILKNEESIIANVPYGYAVATSGSVPLFYSSSAKTSVCLEGGKLWESSFCNQNARAKKDKDTELHLVDGGIHDNHGYKTAIEILSEYQEEIELGRAVKNAKCSKTGKLKCRLIQIDSTTTIVSPLTSGASKKLNSYKLAAGFGTGSGFVGQDSTALRIRETVFDGLGTDTILLDFFAASNKSQDFTAFNANLEGLNYLKDFMATRVNCYDNDGKEIEADKKGISEKRANENAVKRAKADDCSRNNAYRSGTLGKTTYDYDADAGMFPVLWDLGIFVVRQQEAKLRRPKGK